MAHRRPGLVTTLFTWMVGSLVGCDDATSGDTKGERDASSVEVQPSEVDGAAEQPEPEPRPRPGTDAANPEADDDVPEPEGHERDGGVPDCGSDAACDLGGDPGDAGLDLDASDASPSEDAGAIPVAMDSGRSGGRDSGPSSSANDSGTRVTPDADAGSMDLTLTGCTAVPGDRPASTGAGSMEVADLVLDLADRNQPLSGSLRFHDLEGDAANLVVQVNGAPEHYLCPLSAEELEAGEATLDELAPGSAFPDEAQLVYVGVQDEAGSTSAYLVGTIQLGDSPNVSVCRLARPFQLMGRIPSASTEFYTEANGVSAEYRLGAATGSEMTIVRATRVSLDMGTCSHLFLSADAEGSLPVGWDNCLVVEYRPLAGGPVGNAWSYCSSDTATVYAVSTAEPLVQPVSPTVVGTDLDPEVPNPGSRFGHEPWSIDLMTRVPSGSSRFELTLFILDYGAVGSTTDIWATLEP